MDLIKEKKITKKYKNIMITQSLYSLALYIFVNKNLESDTLFLLGDNINYESIKMELSNFIIYDVRSAGPKNITEWMLLSKGVIFGRFKKINKYINVDTVIYGHDHISLSPLFFKREMIIIEDGLSNYTENYNDLTRNQKIKKILNIKFKTKGYSEATKIIYLTGMSKIPDELINKVRLVNRKDFIKGLKSILNGVFYSELKIKRKAQLLITQPLSEDNFISESQKILIYKKLIDKDLILIIKPHPRELTDYKKHFKNAIVINNEKLAESLFDNDNVTDIYTIFSSALISYPFERNVNVHIKGTMNNNSLISKVGFVEEQEIIH
ncbi:glycosyltransferase family 52 [Photobacterium phosphoreum]|uniref:glycosyltransferase family 52 n=1 Tax=Photobacterium phosphoreum TaxID=659 RepID=UPI0007F8B586|nr:glycosyltransferase family 52 [Photobacterium phosphoreum]OBU32392.1 hypothetical protein AYY24_19235 [Photobacterium phosphoreum]